MRAPALTAIVLAVGCSSTEERVVERPRVVVATFNTGTAPEMGHDAKPDDGYGVAQGALTDQHYGNGLSWKRAIEDARRYFERERVDIIGFQEIFHPELCPTVPSDARAGFVCEDWKPGDGTVAQQVMGVGFQVACHLGSPDKCIAVRRSFGSIRGCSADFCADALAGRAVEGCGKAARIGRAVVDMVAGGALTVVNVHGTSGIETSDQDCRVKQFQLVFTDLGLGDGPAANGAHNLVLGDFNTDPYRLAKGDPSAAFVMEQKRFHFVNAVPSEERASYAIFDIDHIMSDTLRGDCFRAGVTDGKPPVTEMVYFDHKPLVCSIALP